MQELFGTSLKGKYENCWRNRICRCIYRDKLPKFNNGRQLDENGKPIRGTGKMVFDHFDWERDGKDIPKIHPTQKPVNLLKRLIEIFTDEGDVVIDPVAGSGSTLQAAYELNRKSFGFEVDTKIYNNAISNMPCFQNDNE